MHNDIVAAQSETLRIWSEEWARDDTPHAREMSFMLERVSRLMVNGASSQEVVEAPLLDADRLPEPEVISTILGD